MLWRIFWWTVPLNRHSETHYSQCNLPENYNKVHKPLLQSVYSISSEILGSKQYRTHHRSAASFLFPVHTGSCLCAWSRRRSLWSCAGQKRRSWRAFPASTPAWSPRPGRGRTTSSGSSKTEYWRSKRRRSGWSRNSCRHTRGYTHVHENKHVAEHHKTHRVHHAFMHIIIFMDTLW